MEAISPEKELEIQKAPNPVGRPSSYTQELSDRICQRLSEGVSLRTVCLADDMPDAATIFRWLRINKEFREQYEAAKQESTDAMAEDIQDIADNGTNDYIEKERPDGTMVEVFNSEHVQRSRLRIDTRKWLMAKMKPKKYADKLDLTTGGEKIEPTGPVLKMTPQQIDEYLRTKLNRTPEAAGGK